MTLLLAAHASSSRAQSADTVASVRWNTLAYQTLNRVAPLVTAMRPTAGSRRYNPIRLRDRMSPLVPLVAYLTADAADKDASKPSRRAAVAAGAASVLALFLPDAKSDLDREVERDVEAERQAGVPAARIDAGVRLGRLTAARVLKLADAERVDATWSGTVPNGQGMWRSADAVAPGLTQRLSDRTWALESADQFRPKPPPAYGSAAFDSGLEAVRRAAQSRTAEQTRIAQRWGLEPAVDSWARIIGGVLLRNRVDDPRAAHILALISIATYDAGIACTDAKYHYWLLRPTQADSTIRLADRLTLPNFPSYPAGHACLSGAMAETIGALVPEARSEVTELAEEAAVSRLYAGVHYPFDNETGLELGRRVARYVIAEDAAGRLMKRWQ